MISLEKMFGSRVYIIPKNQRGYSWTPKEIDDLFSDLDLMGDQSHYLGTVICTKCGDFTDEIDKTPTYRFILEDGQQRLTTFLLIITELRRRFLEIDERETVESDGLNRLITYKKGSISIRIENQNISLDECLKHHIIGHPSLPGVLTPPMKCLQRAKDHIASIVNKIEIRDDLIELRNKVCKQVQIIDVDLASARIDRYLTFDAINSRGLPLTEFDKIKNFCILISDKRKLDISPDDKWYAAISNLEKFGVSSRNIENSFMAELYSVYHGVNTSNNDVHDSFVKEYRTLLEGENAQKERSFKGFIDYWASYSEAFGFINSKNKEYYYNRLCTKGAGQWLDSIDNLGLQGVTKKILTVAFLASLSDSDKTDFEKVCRVCEIYTFRMHALYRYRVDKNSKVILNIANQVLKNNKDSNYIISELGKLLNSSATLKSSISRLMSGELNYKNWNGYLYYFLYEYEVSISASGVQRTPWARSDEEKDNSIEHILPQEHRDSDWWEKHWPNQLIADKYVNRIGNLVLTKGNSYLGRKAIDKKISDPECEYSYTHKKATNSEKNIPDYTDGSSWKELNILKRELDLVKFAIDRWSIPFKEDEGLIEVPETYKEFIPKCNDIEVKFDEYELIDSCDTDDTDSEIEYE
ncbi:DUF262 domain-containing protein [Morganella morganii]|nr:DUF262 domain-containing protein [Morganella morganii]